MGLSKTLLNKVYLLVYDVLLIASPTFHNFLFFRKTNNLNFKNFNSKKADTDLLLLDIFLDENSTFIDVGANIGEYVNRAKKLVPVNNIWAFEPLPKLNRRLKKAFPNINISKIALSDKKGKSAFKIPYIKQQQFLTRATLNTNYVEVEESKQQIIEVLTDTLDNQIQLLNINRVSLIKIDVEGHEWNVLNGAKENLIKHKPIVIVEIEQRHHQFPIKKIIDDICKLNYNCYYFNLSTVQLCSVENVELLQNIDHLGTSAYINNFIFINNDISIAEYNNKLKRFTN